MKKKPTGRPKKKPSAFNPAKTCELLASKACTQEDIADTLNISVDTLRRDSKLYDAWRKGRAKMKVSLRKKQLSQALAGSNAMLIWLGKNILGQKDRALVETASPMRALTPDEMIEHAKTALMTIRSEREKDGITLAARAVAKTAANFADNPQTITPDDIDAGNDLTISNEE